MRKALQWGRPAVLLILLCASAVFSGNAQTGASRDILLLQRQVELLEQALTPLTPRKAVELWARGVKTRNGAVQYAVLSPQLRERTKPHFEQCGWITGVSSPWVDQFQVLEEGEVSPGVWNYRVLFSLQTSAGSAGCEEAHVMVQSCEGRWCVTQVRSKTAMFNLNLHTSGR